MLIHVKCIYNFYLFIFKAVQQVSLYKIFRQFPCLKTHQLPPALAGEPESNKFFSSALAELFKLLFTSVSIIKSEVC